MGAIGRNVKAIFGLCLIGACFIGCQKKSVEQPANQKTTVDSVVVNVVVSELKTEVFEDWGSYSADLRGIEDAYLTAPYQGGRVDSLKPVGTIVKAGDALCDIDGLKYLVAYQASLAQVEVAKGDLERAKINVEKGSLGKSALDGANLAYQSARMTMVSAQRAYEDCRCKAPFDGILVSRAIERFQTVGPGTPTVRLSRLDKLEAVISIPETEAFSFSEGMKTEFRLLQNPDRVYTGTLSSLDRAVDSRSRTINGRILLNNPDRSLKPGMVGRVRILRKVYQNSIIVPSNALLRLQNGISAMVVENGVARQRMVEIETAADNRTLIRKGLNAGEKLIVSGAFQVSDGTRVSY